MRKILMILLLASFSPGILYSQEREMSGSNRQSSQGSRPSAEPAVFIKSTIKSFSLDNQFSYQKPLRVDTSTIDFHIYSPMFQQSISNTYLGYLGAPYISNNFFNRINYADYYFLTSMSAYSLSQHDVRYYNTTTPFAILKYDEGNSSDEKVFRAFFSQNIDSTTNFGFDFNVYAGEGQYKNQKANHKSLNFFLSRNRERYNAYASFISTTNSVDENGGIRDSVVNISTNSLYLPVKLSGVIGPKIKSSSLFASFEYLMGEIPFLKSEAESDSFFIPRYGIQYSAELTRHKRNFTEVSVDDNFFDSIYFDDKSGRIDSSSFNKFSQIIQLKVIESPVRKFTFGKRVFLENEIITAMHPVVDGHRKYNYSNLFVGGEIYNRSNNFLQWSALARFALLGRNLGDAIFKGALYKPLYFLGDTLSIYAEGWYQDISPDIFQNHWQDNHFKWENDFTKQHEIVLKARADWDKINLHTGVNYVMMSNFLYNGYDALPAQFNGKFSVFGFWFNKEFILGPIRWNNKLVLQESTNNTIVHLPTLNAAFSLSLNGILFKVMKYQIGAEVYYNSKFYADRYEPSSSRFYLQDNILTGGYPQLNAFVNAKLKRTSAFAQLSHFNSSFSGGKFFSSPFYPVNQMAFRFGFLWSFYD
jgi:hypothetical protein